MLHYLLAKGNTTCYEYKTGVVPESIEEYKLGLVVHSEDSDKLIDSENAVRTWTQANNYDCSFVISRLILVILLILGMTMKALTPLQQVMGTLLNSTKMNSLWRMKSTGISTMSLMAVNLKNPFWRKVLTKLPQAMMLNRFYCAASIATDLSMN